MTSIGILTDTHGYLDPAIFDLFKNCNELWHAGDWGSNVVQMLQPFKPLKGVYGNIDGTQVHSTFPGEMSFQCEEVRVFMTHIGGYPPRYEPGIKEKLQRLKPDLFICGHSHILKIVRDPNLNNLLCINPGAAGKSGLHKVRTVVRLKIESKRIFEVEAIELGPR